MEEYEKAYEGYKKQKYQDACGNDYIGSAFSHIGPDYSRVDAKFLRNLMPNKHIALRADNMKVIENDCVRYMMMKAEEKELHCRYTVPDIFPGLPRYDPQIVLKELYDKLVKRKGVTVFADRERENTLLIFWMKKDESGSKKDKRVENSSKTAKDV